MDGRSNEETTELLEDLAARALVQVSADGGGAVTVHDLLRDFMEAELGEEGRLAAHRALLDAYQRTQQGQGWATAPDDGYLYDHLAYHLDAVADHDVSVGEELRSLFADQAWMNVRVPQSRYLYDGYLADLDIVWRRAHAKAHRQIDAGEEPAAIGDCVRYALIRTSINSLAANYVPELVARAVEVGLWPAERAVSVARNVPDAAARAKLCAALLRIDALAPGERWQAGMIGLAAAQAIGGEWYRAQALAALAPQLTGDLLREGLAAAQAIGDAEYRVQALAALAPQLTGETRDLALREGLAAALAIGFEGARAEALAALAAQLTGEARDLALREGLAAAQAIGDEEYRAHALAALAPQLTGDLLREGLAAAQAIGNEWSRAEYLFTDPETDRAQALAALAPQLTGEARDLALREGLAAAQAIDDARYRAKALAALAPHLGDQTACLRAIQRAVGDHLRNNLASQRRGNLLTFIADYRLFAPPILSPTPLAAIASHIIEICNDWTWL